jgi:uncharacterized protein (DUF4415 family)
VIKDEARKFAGSFAEQVGGSSQAAGAQEMTEARLSGGGGTSPTQDPRFGYGRGFSENDQMEIKRLRAELRRLKSVARKHQGLYEQSRRAEEERKRLEEEEEEELKKREEKRLPDLGVLDWFKNVGDRAKGRVLGFARRKKKAEFKPGAFRG